MTRQDKILEGLKDIIYEVAPNLYELYQEDLDELVKHLLTYLNKAGYTAVGGFD